MSRYKHLENKGITVIYEDNHLLAVNKRSGDLVHGDESGDSTLVDAVKEYIKIRYNKAGDVFLGVIHRLDRPVSGVVIFARTSKALMRMNESLKNKKIHKEYIAVVSSRPDPLHDTITHYILKDEKKNIVRAYASPKTGTKESVLSYELIGELEQRILLRIHPLTGRSHQIRAQLSKIGCPILGDIKYGADAPLPDKSIGLHCHQMTFEHPTTKNLVTIKAEPPTIRPWTIFNI
jgi:23S rRNA pseudouridine1911/1915/1917 synthase